MSTTLRLIPTAAAAAAAAACLLAACGGGDAGAPPGLSSGGGNPPTTVATSGVAVDGYLSGATALCDLNGNGSADAGEVTTPTDSSGRYTFTAGCNAVVVVSGGTNIDTGLPFTGVLKAPAGATVASPLTTLLVAGLSQAQVNAALGLPAGTDLLATDPAAKVNGALANTALMKATSTVQQLLQKTGELFTSLAGGSASTETQQAVYADVAAAFASQMASGGNLANSSGVMDSAVMASLVKAATQKVAASTTVGAAVKAAAASVNADTLSQVAAGALKAQGEAILGASAATLTDITKTAQTDGAISSFVTANVATLAKPPGADTAALASSLATQVGTVLAAPPSRYLAIAGDAITLANGSASTSYTMAQFQSDAGIRVSWPLPSPMVLKVNLTDIGDAVVASGQQLTAAVAITETTATGKGQLLGYIAKVGVAKSGTALQISLPTSGNDALVYGMSSDGKKQAVIDFGSSVAGVANTLTTGLVNSIALGSVVNYGINQVSNDFTGIYSLRGKYKVTIVLNGLTLRKADGSALPALTVNVPTALGPSGAVTASRSVSGVGLVGYLTLTD